MAIRVLINCPNRISWSSWGRVELYRNYFNVLMGGESFYLFMLNNERIVYYLLINYLYGYGERR